MELTIIDKDIGGSLVNVQYPMSYSNSEQGSVQNVGGNSFFKVPLIVIWHGACIIKALIISDRTSQALYVHVTLQGPHSSHSNSICRNN